MKVILYTKDESLEEEINDISRMFNFDMQTVSDISVFLKTLQQEYFVYIVDEEDITNKNDIYQILPENSIVIDNKKTNKNNLKFLLVDIFKKYEITKNNNLTVNKIEQLLNKEKINAKSIGYKYLIDLIFLCNNNDKYIKHLNELSYVEIATKHNTTVPTVERNIRTTLSDCEDEHQIKMFLKKILQKIKPN